MGEIKQAAERAQIAWKNFEALRIAHKCAQDYRAYGCRAIVSLDEFGRAIFGPNVEEVHDALVIAENASARLAIEKARWHQ